MKGNSKVITTPFKANYSHIPKYKLAVSSDSLYIISSSGKKNNLEVVVKGVDKNGYLFSLDSEYDFLNITSAIKKDILLGRNPLNWILKSL